MFVSMTPAIDRVSERKLTLERLDGTELVGDTGGEGPSPARRVDLQLLVHVHHVGLVEGGGQTDGLQGPCLDVSVSVQFEQSNIMCRLLDSKLNLEKFKMNFTSFSMYL